MTTPSKAKGTERYIVGEVPQFNQKNEMFSRSRWDSSLGDLGRKLWAPQVPQEKRPGYTLPDYAFENAAWHVELSFAQGSVAGNYGLYSWDAKIWSVYGKPPTGMQLEADDPKKITQMIKKAARFFGASLVGIGQVARRWIYSHSHDLRTLIEAPIETPAEYKYAIVMGYEMDYDTVKLSPTRLHGGGVGICYSRMAFAGSIMAQFIRGLGYKAIPIGNDTALSIPLAIDAGLGELSRMGLLITPQFGPRVRVNKVLTNLPLIPDSPIEFGVWDFCSKCEKCARNCPGQAIKYGEPTAEINNISNRRGLFRWPLNAEKCLGFFAQNHGDCSNCIRVCPFNKPPGPLHKTVRWGVKHARFLNPLFIRGDDLFGYGRQGKAARYWD
ncbi:reductive dehalogenase [Chloroflexota bacterium]